LNICTIELYIKKIYKRGNNKIGALWYSNNVFLMRHIKQNVSIYSQYHVMRE
jgi:hypothetical protein